MQTLRRCSPAIIRPVIAAGTEICIREKEKTQDGRPLDLHRFWDGVITTSSNISQLRNEATALRNKAEFSRNQLSEQVPTMNLGHGKGSS